MSSLYRDYDALAYNPRKLGEERGAINHIKKVKQKAKGLEVVFDPKGHRDFLTGFRKRKQQRRKEAIQQLEAKQKKQRVEQRAERRTKLKEELGLPENYGVDESNSEAEEDQEQVLGRADVKVFQQGQVTTTVSVVDLHPDSDGEAGGSGSDDDNDGNDGGLQADDGGDDSSRQQQQQQQQKQQQRGSKPGHKRQHQVKIPGKGTSSSGGVRKQKKKLGKDTKKAKKKGLAKKKAGGAPAAGVKHKSR